MCFFSLYCEDRSSQSRKQTLTPVVHVPFHESKVLLETDIITKTSQENSKISRKYRSLIPVSGMRDLYHLCHWIIMCRFMLSSTGPPTPSSLNISMLMNNSVSGLSVSWELNPEVHGSIQYHVMSDQDLTCNSTSSSCLLVAVGCGEIHMVQVTASNEAGPGYPSTPVVFITCE